MILSERSHISSSPAPKFNALRKKLDQYSYKEPLGLESIELVEKLFIDILNMRDNLKQLERDNLNNNKLCKCCESRNNEYKEEFETLLCENNNLHLQIIHSQEELYKSSKEFNAKFSKIDNENKNLKLLINEYTQTLKDLERESKEKSDCILQMQDKYFFAVIQTTTQPKTNKNQFRRPKLELNNFLSKSTLPDIKSATKINEVDDPKFFDIFKLTEDQLMVSREKLENMKEKCNRLNEKVEEYKYQIENRDAEIDRLTQINNKQKSFYSMNYKAQVDHLQRVIDDLSKNNEMMNSRVAELAKLEEHNFELDELSKEHERRIQQLTSEHREAMDKEMDKYKILSTEVDRLKFLLLSKDQSLKELTKYKEENENNSKNSEIITKLQSEKKKLTNTISTLMNTERELILEIDRLKHNNTHRKPSNASLKNVKNHFDVYTANLEMERDFWKNEFNALSKGPVRKFANDFHNFNNVNKKENMSSKNGIINKQDSILTNDDIFLHICNERDELKVKLENLEKQLNKKLVADNLNTESSDLYMLRSENAILSEQVESLRQALTNVSTTTTKDTSAEVERLKDDVQQHKSLTAQLKLIAERAERSLKECEGTLKKREDELSSLKESLACHQLTISNLQFAKQSEKEEIARLKSVITNLDLEKDDLQMLVDEKTELVVLKTDTIQSKEKVIADLQTNIKELENIIRELRESASDKDKEIRSLQRQVEQLSSDKSKALKEKSNLIVENKRLQDDLSIITNENQSLNQELVVSHQKIANISAELQNCISEIKRCQEIIRSKEHEKNDQSEQCRNLTASVSQLQASLRQLDAEVTSLRMQLMSKDGELRRLMDRYEQLDLSYKDKLSIEQTFNNQLSNQTRTIASLEEAMRNVETEKHKLMLDVAATRDLCMRLEVDKTTLQRQLMNKSVDEDKLQNQISDLRQEVEMLSLRLRNESVTTANLEAIIQTSRSEEWAVQSLLKEKETEIVLLKENLSQNDLKSARQSKEVDELRVKCSQLHSEVEILKRQIINEQFDRSLKTHSHLNRENRIDAKSPISSDIISKTIVLTD